MPRELYIDGAWTAGSGTGVLSVENPATQETVAVALPRAWGRPT